MVLMASGDSRGGSLGSTCFPQGVGNSQAAGPQLSQEGQSLDPLGAAVAGWGMALRCPPLPRKVNTPHYYSSASPHNQIYNNDFYQVCLFTLGNDFARRLTIYYVFEEHVLSFPLARYIKI